MGYSGNTGNTANKPHLHLSVYGADCTPDVRGTSVCSTVPFNFRNTDPNPEGPQAGRRYRAQ